MSLSHKEIEAALADPNTQSLFAQADLVRKHVVGDTVFLRGLVEASNWCVRNCLYCGLRRANEKLVRYRMTAEEISSAAASAYALGLRTVVIQTGDGAYPRGEICRWIRTLRQNYADMAITLSLGERPEDDYRAFRDAGADRYLLKHETINPNLYERLHPGQKLNRRLKLLEILRSLGYQVGTGFIVGLPGQELSDLRNEILFLQTFQPDMVGVGPFMPQRDTPLGGAAPGALHYTLKCLALARLVTVNALIPATTALLSLDPEQGLEGGLRAGANVVMINVGPETARRYYRLYDDRARLTMEEVMRSIRRAGRLPSGARGDSFKLATNS